MLTRARAKHRVFFFPLILLYEGNTINNGEKGDPQGQNAGIDPDARIIDLRTRSILEGEVVPMRQEQTAHCLFWLSSSFRDSSRLFCSRSGAYAGVAFLNLPPWD